MVWPIFPLVAENLLRVSLAASAGSAVCLGVAGLNPLWGILSLFGLGAYCRAKRALVGPSTKPQGRCSRADHVKRVQAAEAAAKLPGPLRMFKATTSNTFRPKQIGAREESRSRLDLSGFVHVLEINVEELWCDIEASATFETFTAETLAVGTAPLVIPELRTITVGGAVVGIGIESSSFRHGFFHEGLLEADILLASGEVVTMRPEGEYADLFRAVPNSLGSFGYLLRLRMRIQPSQPFVRLEKTWFPSPVSLVAAIDDACGTDADFVEAVALGDHGGMLMTAKFVKEVPAGSAVRQYGVWPIFYKSLVEEGVEYMSSSGYVWRWDADWFWCTQIFPGLSWRFVRWLCGPELLRSDMYKMFNDSVISHVLEPLALNKDEELVIQDIEIPISRSAEYIHAFLRAVPSLTIGKIRLQRPGLPLTVPIWLCPVKGTSFPLMPMNAEEMYINFGFWDALEGPETKGGAAAGKINRALEELCPKLGGKKTLYSAAYFSEEEFYEQYNGDLYHGIKRKYDPDGRLRGWYERLMKR